MNSNTVNVMTSDPAGLKLSRKSQMLIQSLRVHFAVRAMEWLGAGMSASWGYYVVTHPQIFTNPETAALFSGLVHFAEVFGQSPAFIGVLALCNGIFRALALFVNGSYQRTPLIRLVTAFSSALLWTSVSLGLMASAVANTGVILYPWLVVGDIVSGYRAGYDLVIAENTAREAREINGQPDSRERGLIRRVGRRIFPGLA